MTFDEQLNRVFEAVHGRLQDEIARLVRDVVGDLAVSAKADREAAALEARRSAEREAEERLAAALADCEAAALEARRSAEREADERLAAALAAAAADAVERTKEEGTRQKEEGRREGREEGTREGRETGRQQGLEQGRREAQEEGREEGKRQKADGKREGREEGLREGLEAGRIEGERHAQQVSQHAVDQAYAAARAELLAAELAARQRLVDSVRSLGRSRSLSEILDTLVSCAAREAARAAVLLLRGERFFGWRFIGFGSAFEAADRIEFGADEAGVVEKAKRSVTAAMGADAPPFAALPTGREGFAVPIAMDGQVVAVLYADQGETEAASIVWAETLEILARHAGRCLETVTAFKAARAVVERADSAKPVTPHDDSTAAQRYARLLVSEIKLYHEADVVAGRRERDLATRLGGEIARARVLYERRVPADVRAGTDHFHIELVRTLANGDESLLELKT